MSVQYDFLLPSGHYSSALEALSNLHWLHPLVHGRFLDRYFKCSKREGDQIFGFFFFIWTSATKRFARSRILRYGLPQDILNIRQRKREGGAYSAPLPPWIKGLKLYTTWINHIRNCKYTFQERMERRRDERQYKRKKKIYLCNQIQYCFLISLLNY